MLTVACPFSVNCLCVQRGKVPYGRPAPSEYHLPPSLAFHPPTEDRYDRCNGSNGSSDEDEDGYMSVDDDTSSRGHDGRRRRRRADRRSVESLKEEELLAVNQLLSIRSLLQVGAHLRCFVYSR